MYCASFHLVEKLLPFIYGNRVQRPKSARGGGERQQGKRRDAEEERGGVIPRCWVG
jgi:hypothetical protein